MGTEWAASSLFSYIELVRLYALKKRVLFVHSKSKARSKADEHADP